MNKLKTLAVFASALCVLAISSATAQAQAIISDPVIKPATMVVLAPATATTPEIVSITPETVSVAVDTHGTSVPSFFSTLTYRDQNYITQNVAVATPGNAPPQPNPNNPVTICFPIPAGSTVVQIDAIQVGYMQAFGGAIWPTANH